MSRRRRQVRIGPSVPVPRTESPAVRTEADGNVALARRTDGADPVVSKRDPLRRRIRNDGWYSLVSALGGEDDKVTQHRFRADRLLTPEELSALYHGDDLAARICDALPLEALRQPVEIIVGDPEKTEKPSTAGPDDDPKVRRIGREPRADGAGETGAEISTAVQMALRELGAQEKIAEAAIWGRTFGGAAILLGTDDGQPHQPLNPAGVTRLRFLRVLDRRCLQPVIWYSDPAKDDKFGQPMVYRVWQPTAGAVAGAVNGVMVHESRLVMFGGALTAETERVRNSGWDHSVLQRVWSVLQQTNHAWQAVQHMLGNASQAVMSIANLQQLIEDGDKDVLIDRLEVLQLARLMKIMPIDAEKEKFEYVEQTFTGVESLVVQLFQRLGAAARMPLTVLFGMSPAGLNATGESDLQIWYDQVRGYQIHDLKSRIERIVEILFLSKEGPTAGVEPDEWDVDFAPLEQMSPKEVSELRLTDAQADEIRINSGVLLAGEATASRFRPEGYGDEIQIDTEARAEQAKAGQATVPLNGAQVQAVVDVVVKVAAGELPRAAGVAIVAAATGRPITEADALVGDAGTDAFEAPAKAPVGGAPFGQGAPAEPKPEPSGPPEPDEPAPDDATVERRRALAERLAAGRRAQRAA